MKAREKQRKLDELNNDPGLGGLLKQRKLSIPELQNSFKLKVSQQKVAKPIPSSTEENQTDKNQIEIEMLVQQVLGKTNRTIRS